MRQNAFAFAAGVPPRTVLGEGWSLITELPTSQLNLGKEKVGKEGDGKV